MYLYIDLCHYLIKVFLLDSQSVQRRCLIGWWLSPRTRSRSAWTLSHDDWEKAPISHPCTSSLTCFCWTTIFVFQLSRLKCNYMLLHKSAGWWGVHFLLWQNIHNIKYNLVALSTFTLLCSHHSLVINSSMYTWVASTFYCIINAAMSIGIQIPVWVSLSPEVEMCNHIVILCLIFEKWLYVSHSSFIISHFYQ